MIVQFLKIGVCLAILTLRKRRQKLRIYRLATNFHRILDPLVIDGFGGLKCLSGIGNGRTLKFALNISIHDLIQFLLYAKILLKLADFIIYVIFGYWTFGVWGKVELWFSEFDIFELNFCVDFVILLNFGLLILFGQFIFETQSWITLNLK